MLLSNKRAARMTSLYGSSSAQLQINKTLNVPFNAFFFRGGLNSGMGSGNATGLPPFFFTYSARALFDTIVIEALLNRYVAIRSAHLYLPSKGYTPAL